MKNLTPLLFVCFFFLQNTLLAQQPIVAVSDQMNVIYIGIENPITVAVSGVDAKNVEVYSEDVEVKEIGLGRYILIAKKPGKATLNVQPKDLSAQEIIYRVKRIPDPVTMMGKYDSGEISLDYLHKQTRIYAWLQCFDLGECAIKSFTITVQSKSSDPIDVQNHGSDFNETTMKLLSNVKSGDIIYFDEVIASCTGDKGSRKLNSMIFKIK